ncbi:MAG: hypothetical protein K2J31_05685 [Alistipes sp.]|nr:hypothetical protein [Alistipes sp.]
MANNGGSAPASAPCPDGGQHIGSPPPAADDKQQVSFAYSAAPNILPLGNPK